MYVPARDFAGMKVFVVPDADNGLRRDGRRSSRNAIRPAQSSRGRAVLGLATGSTPEKVYAQLVEWHRAGSLSFRNVTTYNLDEYYPISPLDPEQLSGVHAPPFIQPRRHRAGSCACAGWHGPRGVRGRACGGV